MTPQDFDNCSKEDLFLAAKACAEQARAHFDVADQAARLEHYGIANSLIILSVEEAIKSMILMTGFFGIKFPYDVTPFFDSQKAKHEQGAQVQPFAGIAWKIRDGHLSIGNDGRLDWIALIKLGVDLAVASITKSEPALERFSGWWSTANEWKNNGFYVGFDGGKWFLPSQITKDTYDIGLQMARPFVECLQVINQLEFGEPRRSS